VAVGDSSTEGLDDPIAPGQYRGWADRLARHLADAQGNIQYANFGVRGRRTREVLHHQLPRALALRPDLVTVFTGTNDVVARRFCPEEVAEDLGAIHRQVRATGATLLTFTLPDLTPVMPLARLIRGRILTLNDLVRTTARHSGALLLDFAEVPATGDPRLWSPDRLHANSAGHARIAAALAQALGLAGADPSWHADLPPAAPRGALAVLGGELRWGWSYFLPWALRHLRGQSSGDAIEAKRPDLEWVIPPVPESASAT
jgi:lysophospholipase L1-like esterase